MWQMPHGVSDPLFEHELAELLHMPVGELYDRMSLHELTVRWPAFFAYKRRVAEQQAERQRRGL